LILITGTRCLLDLEPLRLSWDCCGAVHGAADPTHLLNEVAAHHRVVFQVLYPPLRIVPLPVQQVPAETTGKIGRMSAKEPL